MTRLDATGLSKSYGGVCVLAGVDLAIDAGEIRALVGENGAGKSTLIKILSGAVRPDSGSVAIDGRPLPLGDPRATSARGVAVVYQEMALVHELSVAENIFLGREPGRPWLRPAEMQRRAQAVLDSLAVPVQARAAVRGLSVAHQQMVEIARALVTDARLLILDEPTATLSQSEVDALFGVLRQLRARGLGILYVSHRLEEIFSLANRVTVLRDGRHVATRSVEGLTRDLLIRDMVGRDVSEEFPARSGRCGPVVLQVRNLSAPPRVSGVSLDVRAGEIVALAGLVGAGRTSAALALMGAIPAAGSIRLGNIETRFGGPDEAIAAGLAYVTEDRKGRGILAQMGVDDNITLTHLSTFAHAGLLPPRKLLAAAAEVARDFDLRAATLSQPAGTLSGGNQQKALVGRYLIRPPRVLILDEPTRGVDVGARAEIYRAINRLTEQGLGILMISSDLLEVLGMADRIIVMRAGRVAGELSRAEASSERVMALAAAS